MKQKLFSIFFVLAISIGSLWAQTSTTTNYTWDELYQEPYEALSGSTTTMYKYVWARGGGNYPAFWFYILFRKSEMVTYNGRTYPAKGNYTISSNLGTPNVIANYQVANTEAGSTTKCMTEYDVSGQKYYYPISGSGKVEEGADLPYITYSATSNQNANGYTVSSGQYQKIYVNVGSPATYYNVNVVSNNNSYGTVTSTYKSGYVYANNRSQEYKKNSVYTITATPKSGYRFVSWSDGGAQTHDITITGDQTYTATFAPNAATQYTISTAVTPAGYGTVSGAGQYYENDQATLTATSANEHLYIFDHWLKDDVTYEGGTTITPTVTSGATYTAVFRNANAGTITGVAANGTISGTGYYAGGTPVELTVTPNDGYIFTQWSDGNTDNPRTVYVDGDATYTAQFEEGVEIIIADGTCNDESGYFNFIGSANGYSVRIESASVALRTGDFSYSQLEQTSDYTYVKLNNNNIELDYSRQRANVSFWSHTHLLLEAWEYDTSGKEYHIYIKAPLPNSNEINSANSAYDVQSFPSVDDVTAADEDGKAWIYANKGGNPGTGYYVYNTWLAFMPDNTKYGKVPTGIYPIKGTEEAETAVGGYNVQIDGNGYLSSMDGCVAQRRNGYVENIWIPVDGTIEVVNVDEQYWVNVQGKSSYKQNVYFTIGTAPFNVNITSAGNGSVDILLNATNWGTTVHYDEGTSKFFSGNSITLTATPNSGYEFWRWSDEDASVKTSAYGASRNVTVSGNLTLQAIFRVAGPATHTLTWDVDGGTLVGTAGVDYLAAGEYEEGTTITLPDATREGYTLDAWSFTMGGMDLEKDAGAEIDLDEDVTFTATWTQATTLYLYDNKDATYYNNIKALNGQTYDVTYHRSVAYTSDNGNARWYTLCLPFDVDQSQLTNAGLLRKVYEYRYAIGSADVGDQVTFHFRVATSMVAGQGYLVKATGDMGPNFTFTGVTLNTSADVEDGNVDNLKNSNAYKESGDIAIVGVLRSGTLSNDDRKVMGLANNKIWYPHTNGNPMPAYRAYFYNPTASPTTMPRVRIVVEGEGTTELEVVDGELYDARGNDADGDVRAPRKYIRNGVLIIERNGVRYDAQGKRL